MAVGMMRVKPTNIIDLLREGSKFDKEMEQARLSNILAGHNNTIKGAEAQYAPQMSQEELKKIQLFNMIQQAKAKYAEQNEQASLQDILAGTNVKNQTARNWQLHNQYLPREKEAAIQKSEMENEYFPQKMENETKRSVAYGNKNTPENLKKKNAPEVARIQSQLNELKTTGIDPVTGNKLSGRQLEDQTHNYQMALDKAVTSSDDYRFLSSIGMNMDLFSEINKRQIAQNYGLFAKIKMGLKNAVKPIGYNDEVLNQFDQFLHQVAPTSAESMRFAFKGSIQPSNLKKWYDQIVPNAWNNPKSAYSKIVQFEKQMHDETRSRLKNVPRDGYFRQFRFKDYNLIPGDIEEQGEQKTQMSSQQGQQNKAMIIQQAKDELARRKREGLYNG